MYQKNKYSTQVNVGFLEPPPISSLLYKDILMDFITSLPKYGEANSISIIIDRFSKFVRFISMTIFLKESKEELKTALNMIVSLLFDGWISL